MRTATLGLWDDNRLSDASVAHGASSGHLDDIEGLTVSESVTGVTAPPTTTTEPPVLHPRPRDYKVDLIVLEDQCFDSAGALVTVEPELTIVGLRASGFDGNATLVYGPGRPRPITT